MPTNSPMMDKETSEMLRTLVAKGALGSGVKSPPTERFYGIEAGFSPHCGIPSRRSRAVPFYNRLTAGAR